MKVLQWVLYFFLLGAFVWFVFFRDVTLFAKSDNPESMVSEEPFSEEMESGDYDYLDDEAAFVDEASQPDTFTDVERELSNSDNNEFEVVENQTPQPVDEPSNLGGSIDLDKKYLVIVGSFGKLSNAERMLKRVEKSGNQAVITKINGLNRVVAAATNDNDAANRKRDEFTALFKERAFVLEQ